MASKNDSKWKHWALCFMHFTHVDIRKTIIGVYERERLLGVIRQSRVKALDLRLGNTVKIDGRYWNIHPASEEFFLRYRRWININGEEKEKLRVYPYNKNGGKLLQFGLPFEEIKRINEAEKALDGGNP